MTVLDSLLNGHRAAVDRRATFIQGDLADRATLEGIFDSKPIDAVMHFAALLNVAESVRDPLDYWRNNVALTLNLLDAMTARKVKRFIFSSTCAVYGEPEDLPISEEFHRKPINPYGNTKLAVELMLRDAAVAFGLGSVSLRYFNAAGAAADGTIGESHKPEVHLIPLVLQVALGQRESVTVYGNDYPTADGSCVRDYVHVEDLAEAHVLALEKCEPGQAVAYNVGTGSGTSVLEVISAARDVTGHPIPAVVSDRRPGDPPALYADASRIKAVFGWEARHRDIRTIIASAWKWHQAHPHGFENE